MRPEIAETLRKLEWMRSERIWPNGPRYLWTDAFGVVLLVSLAEELRDDRYVDAAEWVVAAVGRVLGRPRGIRIGEAPDRDGQYFHYLAMWLFALHVLAEQRPAYRQQAIGLVRQIHSRFVRPGVGVIWKMREDLSAPYPGFGLGALDPFHGYVIYRLLGEDQLAEEIRDMQGLVQRLYRDLHVTDLGGELALAEQPIDHVAMERIECAQTEAGVRAAQILAHLPDHADAGPDEAWMDLADEPDSLLAIRWPLLREHVEREEPHREVMEVLPIAVGGLADPDAAGAAQHPLHLRHDPLRFLRVPIVSQLVAERDEEDHAEGIRPEIARPVGPDSRAPHPVQSAHDLLDERPHQADGTMNGWNVARAWASPVAIGRTACVSPTQMYSSNWWGSEAWK